MNAEHLRLCASPEWAETVEQRILPWALGSRTLGDAVLEVGAGPGLTTDVLRARVPKLTAVELDPDLAAALAERLAGSNVQVVQADATALPFEAVRFSAATSFTMLHHVPTAALQDRLLAELCRVLRPGGILLGVDSIPSPRLAALHEDDIYVPLDAATLPRRLRAAGFSGVEVEQDEHRLRFFGVKG